MRQSDKSEFDKVIFLDAKWIFFDVGSTLVDETEAYNHRAREMIDNTDITFSVFDEKRIELAKQGFDGNSEAIKYFGLKKTPWHSEDEIPFEDALDTLESLKKRGYKLGIIANQSAGTAQRLENWGLLKYFDVVAASAELGVSKPDRLIFEKAIELRDKIEELKCKMEGKKFVKKEKIEKTRNKVYERTRKSVPVR